MTAFLGLWKKELKVAFTTPLAYAVVFVFTAFASILFWMQLLGFETALAHYQGMDASPELLDQLNFNDAILSPVFVNLQVIFLLASPLLTMRTVAEERRQRTFELLLTAPIRSWQIALAKYCGYLVPVLLVCVIVLAYPAILAGYGSSAANGPAVDWPTALLGVAGIFLTAAMFGAVGLFFSTITESQALAGLASFFALLLLWLALPGAGQATQGLAGQVLLYLSPISHMSSFARGLLSLADVVYYLSFIALFLFLSHRVIEGQRWS